MGYWYIFDTWLDDNSVGCWAYYDLHRWGDRWNIIFNLLVDLWNRDGGSAAKYIYIYTRVIFNIQYKHDCSPSKGTSEPQSWNPIETMLRIGDLKQQHMGVKSCNSKTGLMITLKSTMANLQILCIQPERPYIYIHITIYIYIYITLYIYIHIYILAWYSLASKPFKELAHARLQHYDVYKPWWV